MVVLIGALVGNFNSERESMLVISSWWGERGGGGMETQSGGVEASRKVTGREVGVLERGGETDDGSEQEADLISVCRVFSSNQRS